MKSLSIDKLFLIYIIMITNIEKFKINEASKKKTDGIDLILVDFQEANKKGLDKEFLKSVNIYCKDYSRVFQIWDNTVDKKPSYTFNNQVKLYSKEYGRELSISDVQYLFHKPQQEIIKNKIKNIPDEYDMFETIHNEMWVYLGFEKWILLSSELIKLFNSFKNQNRKIILIGNKKTTNDIYHILRKLNVDVEYNFEFIFNEKQKITNESVVHNDIKIYNPTEFYKYISTNGPNNTFDVRFKRKNDGGTKAFKYYQYEDYNNIYVNDSNTLFFGIFENDLMVGLARIYLNDENKLDNIWWLTYLCIDPLYEGSGYASKLADYLFKYFSDNSYTFETSSYTDIGFIKLKPMFNKLALKYNVTFIDKEKF